jgi:hypothetical protein
VAERQRALSPRTGTRRMTSLKYRIKEDTSVCRWEVLTDRDRIIASGSEATTATARAAAMLEGIRAAISERTNVAMPAAGQSRPGESVAAAARDRPSRRGRAPR